jgi:hypothetical protein
VRPAEPTRVLKREQRHAWRGQPGRRYPKPVRTTFGRKQQQAAIDAAVAAARAAMAAELEVTA